MTTGDKVAYGVAAGAVGLYALKNTDAVRTVFGSSTTFSTDDSTTDDSDGDGFPIWGYGVILIIILFFGAYITREVVG